jgi:hypothetical protein
MPTSLTSGTGRSGPPKAIAIRSASYQDISGPKRTTSSSPPAR